MAYLDDITAIWEIVKQSFYESLPDSAVDLWFRDLKLVAFEDDQITFSTNSEFKYKIINERYLPMMIKGFEKQLGFPVEISVVCQDPYQPQSSADEKTVAPAPASHKERTKTPAPESDGAAEQGMKGFPNNYNFEYTFSNFIVGSSNKFAHAACVAVADQPAKNYNPLFIYGDSGLGKTHLMYAMVNEIKRKQPDAKIVYVSCEDFANQVIVSISSSRMAEFRALYRHCDVLLIDDIQFLTGKGSTQEEFFNTFNALYEDHKQIILTSDRPPREISPLEDRIKTRFEWGLIADIQPPDLELRTAIIKKKAEQVNVAIPDDVLFFLAENLRSNIRQLEGAIKILAANSFLNGSPVSMSDARDCIFKLVGSAEPLEDRLNRIVSIVAQKYHVSREDILGKSRVQNIALARHVAIYLSLIANDVSTNTLGAFFHRDHSSVISSRKAVEARMKDNHVFVVEIQQLKKEIGDQ